MHIYVYIYTYIYIYICIYIYIYIPRCFATPATVPGFRVLMGLLDLVRYSVLGRLEYWLGEVLDGPMYLKIGRIGVQK